MVSIPRVIVVNMNTFFIWVVLLKDDIPEKRLQEGHTFFGKIYRAQITESSIFTQIAIL
jgi:hypothetical protein